MNKYCKDALYHAWTNTSKEEVSNYNKDYYSKHKEDWVTRKLNRQSNKVMSSNIGNSSKNVEESKRKHLDYEKAGGILYDIIEAGKNFIKNAIDTTIEWRKTVHEERHDTSNTIGALLKSGWNWLKNWFNS